MQIFISYARADWDTYVEPLVKHLRGQGFTLWIDQDLIRGGDDWLDEINFALRQCDVLLLCVSPTALNSRFVKMEYRYFWNNDKLIIPVMCKSVPKPDLPAELQTIQYQPFNLSNVTKTLRAYVNRPKRRIPSSE